jgi:hypothetical protein
MKTTQRRTDQNSKSKISESNFFLRVWVPLWLNFFISAAKPTHDFMKHFASILFAALLVSTVSAFSAETANPALTYVDLVQRLTDLEHLATLPVPGEKTAQFSSYDRASRYDETTGKYIHWDANGDNNGVIRKEDGKYVLAEMNGPGCLWRIWSAAPKQGHVRIYLDGDANPAVDLPFAEYFSGKQAPFTRPAIVHIVSQGCNNYTPIPFQKSCKIVADENWGAYYHFGYTTFPPGTQMPTFKRELSPAENAALDAADKILGHCGPREFPSGQRASAEGMLAGHGSSGTEPGGAEAITGIRVRFDPPLTATDRDLLREISLQMQWDGEGSPSVWAPLGDFFGTAPGANVYRSLPCGYTEDGWFYANWFMPFTNGAKIHFVNEGSNNHRLTYEIYSEEIHGDLTRYARFHAKWHRDAFLPTEPERQIDWPLLKTTGAGRFVGVMLHVWNPRGGWWGEGDEKFFVDGEKFPSTFGTGSEDYFGYAWGSPVLFQHAFHNQTHNDGNNKGHLSVNRWHISDQVPFQKQFEGDLEKYFSNDRPTRFASTAFWYLAPGGNDPYSPVPVEERTNYYAQPAVKKVPGVTEGEQMKILSQTGGNPSEQDMTAWPGQWSNDAQLWWTATKPGDKLELALPVAKAGKYQLLAQLTKAVDYGIVQLSLDGENLGPPVDLFHKGVIATGELDLGTRELSAGEHKLAVEIIGANPKAVKSFMFGLDYVKLVAVK